MKLTNKYGLPDSIVRAVSRDTYTKGRAFRSITQLIGSPRVATLRDLHDRDIESDVADQVFALIGKAVHWIAEQGADGKSVAEERLFAEVNGWTISGQIDLQEVHDGGISVKDYKVTSVYSFQASKPEWEQQLNCYAWLVRKVKKLKVGKLQIVCIMRDWQRSKMALSDGYPPAPIQVVEIPDWGFEEQERYILERVGAHQDAEVSAQMGTDLPLCSDEDRWIRDSKWAVTKKGGKRALRIFDSIEEAEAHIRSKEDAKDLLVEYRPGVPTRCEQNYCSVAPWCEQFQNELVKSEFVQNELEGKKIEEIDNAKSE
jgi:hypothetical protein